MGDAWEEIYYPGKIEECKPYEDKSNTYRDIYPRGTDTFVSDAGDGFINFERYRGIMGVIGGAEERLVRMNPKVRSIMAANIIDHRYPMIPQFYQIPKGIEYFSNIEIPDSVKVYEIEQNPSIKQWEYYRYFGTYSEGSNCISRFSSSCYEGQEYIPLAIYGTMRVNGLLPNIPNSAVVPLIYISPYRDPPKIIQQMLGRNFDFDKHPGVTRRPPNLTDDLRYPKTVQGCWYFESPISKIVQTNVGDPNKWKDLIQESQKLILGHEMGHFVSLKHASIDTNTIMKETFIITPNGKIIVPQNFNQEDYRWFRLAE